MTNDAALIERLRNDAVYVEEVIPSKVIASAIAEHLRDAAVEIETLRAKVKLAFVQEIVNENESLRAENASLKALLCDGPDSEAMIARRLAADGERE